VGNVPVGDDYVIGPGDSLNLIYWGTVNQTLSLTVDRDGSISIPSLGPIQVGGLRLVDAKKTVEGKVNQITGVKTQLTMGQLRTITVNVVGEVSQPGAYSISGLSRVTNALVAAGGIAKTGSLRKIELRRGNQLIRRVDLYDILLHGDNSADERLQQDDVIFVPVIGDVAAVAGDVKRPAIYEFTTRDQLLGQVLQLAGGITAFSYKDRLQVERVENHQKQVVLDQKLSKLNGARFKIADGDLVKIYPVLGPQRNLVVLAGNVRRPDNYQWFKGLRVADLVKRGEGVLPHTYFRYALIERLWGPQRYIRYYQVDLGRALQGGAANSDNALLMPLDELYIYSLDQLRDLPQVTVSGEVRAPGTYPLNQDMRVSDLIYLANGLKEDAYKPKAAVVRVESKDGKAVHRFMDVDLQLALSASHTDADPLLKNLDQIYIAPVVGWIPPPRTVIASGEFINPATFTFHQGMRLRDLLAQAGGLKDDAYLKEAELVRTQLLPDSRTSRVYMKIDLNRLLSGDQDGNILLEFNDQLFVSVAPNWHMPWVVQVGGRVARPGSYPIGPNDTLFTVLEKCGGLLPDAYAKGAVFTRQAVKQSEQQSLNQAQQQLSASLAQLMSMSPMVSSAGSGNASTTMQASIATLQQVMASSQGVQADGRIVIHMENVKPHAQEDFQVQDGDSLTIPTRPASVNIMGQVYNPTSIVASKSLTVGDYLSRAGGATPAGDANNLLVVKADGSVITDYGLKHTGQSQLFPLLPAIGGGIMTVRLDPGDTVYIPVSLVNLQSEIRWQHAGQITQVFAQTAQALGVVGLLATR
jgi:protein involved in polysaccharide export with SLBB domain